MSDTKERKDLDRREQDRDDNIRDLGYAIGTLSLLMDPALCNVECSSGSAVQAALGEAWAAMESAIECLDRARGLIESGNGWAENGSQIGETIGVHRAIDAELPIPGDADVYTRMLIVADAHTEVPYTGAFEAARDAYARANGLEPLGKRLPIAHVVAVENEDFSLRVYRTPAGELVVLQS